MAFSFVQFDRELESEQPVNLVSYPLSLPTLCAMTTESLARAADVTSSTASPPLFQQDPTFRSDLTLALVFSAQIPPTSTLCEGAISGASNRTPSAPMREGEGGSYRAGTGERADWGLPFCARSR